MKLQVEGLRKSFDEREVLHGVSFSVESGSALGLLGRNGAGKSTTIRILMDVFKANAGVITLDGKPFQAKAYAIGYMPEERGLYPKKKVSEQLLYLAQLRGCGKKIAKANMQKLLKRLHIEEYEERQLDTLSKGNQQKIQLVEALICDPDIIILDEPFSGLDPVNAQMLKEVVSEEIARGKLVIFSSHQMNYVEEFCEDIVILHHGDVVLSGNLKQIKKEFGENRLGISAVNYTATDLAELLRQTCQELVSVLGIKAEYLLVELKQGASKQMLLQKLLASDVDIEKFVVYEAPLTDIFVAKAGDEQ